MKRCFAISEIFHGNSPWTVSVFWTDAIFCKKLLAVLLMSGLRHLDLVLDVSRHESLSLSSLGAQPPQSADRAALSGLFTRLLRLLRTCYSSQQLQPLALGGQCRQIIAKCDCKVWNCVWFWHEFNDQTWYLPLQTHGLYIKGIRKEWHLSLSLQYPDRNCCYCQSLCPIMFLNNFNWRAN